MKRSLFGVLLLISLFLLSLWTEKLGDRGPEEISGAVHGAGILALAGDWEGADRLAQKAASAWEQCRDLQSWLRHDDHLQMVDELFSEIRVYRQGEEACHYAAACFSLEARTKVMAGQKRLRFPVTGQ